MHVRLYFPKYRVADLIFLLTNSAIIIVYQIEDLQRLCKLGSRTPGHPENVVTDGIEVTTGITVILAFLVYL